MKKSALDMKSIARVASCVRISAKDYTTLELKGIAREAKGRIVIADANELAPLDLKSIASCGTVEFDFV